MSGSGFATSSKHQCGPTCIPRRPKHRPAYHGISPFSSSSGGPKDHERLRGNDKRDCRAALAMTELNPRRRLFPGAGLELPSGSSGLRVSFVPFVVSQIGQAVGEAHPTAVAGFHVPFCPLCSLCLCGEEYLRLRLHYRAGTSRGIIPAVGRLRIVERRDAEGEMSPSNGFASGLRP